MNRFELSELLQLLVNTGRLGREDAARLLRLFDAGSLTGRMLPLAITRMPGVITTLEAARAQGAVVARLTATAATAFTALGNQPVTRQTPPAVQRFLRIRTRNHFRGEFERTMTRMAGDLQQSGDVNRWHSDMQGELRAYYIRMHTAGVGRPPTQAEIQQLSQQAIRQQAYLQRFAGEVSARQALGNPASQAAVANRSILYGGPGWAAWQRGNETAEVRGDGEGTIVHYRARDDGNTCSPCHDAARGGPYLPFTPHPIPGAVCLGGGRCRCELDYEYDPQTWARLAGRREAA